MFQQFSDPVPGEKPGNTTRWWCLPPVGSQSRQMKEEVAESSSTDNVSGAQALDTVKKHYGSNAG